VKLAMMTANTALLRRISHHGIIS